MKHRRAKGGYCRAFRSPKLRYQKRAVADFDCAIVNTKAAPGHECEVFRCSTCGDWHIGGRR